MSTTPQRELLSEEVKVRFPETTIEGLDVIAAQMHGNRSQVIRMAVAEFLAGKSRSTRAGLAGSLDPARGNGEVQPV